MFFCPYCGRDRPERERFKPEHPLPQTIGGGGWHTRDVCDDCNEYCGREIDQPFASDIIVRHIRHCFEIPDTYGRIPPAPRIVGRTVPSGQRIQVELGRHGIRSRRLPHQVFADETSQEFIVEPGEGKHILKVRMERLRQQLDVGFEVRGRLEDIDDAEDEVLIDFSMSANLWPRLGAKLGLGLGARGMDSSWSRSDWADWLRARLHGNKIDAPDARATLSVLPETLPADDPLAMLAKPPHHTIFFVGTDPTVLMIHLFGVWRYVVPLGPGGPRDGPAWTFDPRRDSASETTFSALVLANRHRYGVRV